MTYLLSQIFVSLLLAALAGGALGWILHGLKAHQRERELSGLINRHATALTQAQQERQMIADDYDDMKLSLESRIGELQLENRKIPELHNNLEKSQQLVQQMIKTRDSEIADATSTGDALQRELDTLRVQQKNDGSEIAALRKANAELGGNNSHFQPAGINPTANTSVNTTLNTAADTAINTKANPAVAQPVQTSQSSERKSGAQISTSQVAQTATAPALTSKTATPRDSNIAPTTTGDASLPKSPDNSWASRENNNPVTKPVTPATAQVRTTNNTDQTASTADSFENRASFEEGAVTQAELLELESEIEEMRGYDQQASSHSTPFTSTGTSSASTNTAAVNASKTQDSKTGSDSASDATKKIAAATVATAAVATTATAYSNSSTENTTGNSGEVSKPVSQTPERVERMDPIEPMGQLENSSTHEPSISKLRSRFSPSSTPNAADDLQTIHGIGPVIEKSLNDIGITNYRQIAKLTRQEIEEIADILEIFPGRIERDNWIGSARKLASEASPTNDTDTITSGNETSSKKDVEKILHAEEV